MISLHELGHKLFWASRVAARMALLSMVMRHWIINVGVTIHNPKSGKEWSFTSTEGTIS
jgi:hypothetical protein